MTNTVRLLTLLETAERLRKTEQGLRWMINKGTAPKHAKIGGRIMFSEAEVDGWVAAQFEAQEAAQRAAAGN